MITVRFILTRLHLLRALLPLLTLRKVLNLLHAAVRFFLGTTRAVAHPPVLILSLTTHCNYKCRMCLKSTSPTSGKGALEDYRHPREMDFAALEALLREHADYLCMVRLHGGEPTQYRNFVPLVHLLNQLRIPFNIITNGSLLTEELCEALVGGYCFGVGVSLDAGRAETYRYIRRGGELSTVLANLRRLNALKRARRSVRPVLSASMCTFAANIGEVTELLQICHEHGIPSLSVGEGMDYDTPFTTAAQLARNNKALFRAELSRARAKAKELGLILRLRFPSLAGDSEPAGDLPRQVPVLPPKNCLNLYASVWLTPSLEAIGCSASAVSWGSVRDRGLDAVWNGTAGRYASARRDLRNHVVPEGCSGCIYTGGFAS